MAEKAIPIFLVSCLGGYVFSLAHVPLPWTLGPLAASALWTAFVKLPVYWPKRLRNWGLLILGYVMGSPFTLEVGQRMLAQLPVMLLATVMTISVCLLTGYIAGRYSGIGLANSLIGSLPGGLSQMTAVCEEIRGTNVAIVTLMQTIRVITVVFVVPFLTLHALADSVQQVNLTSRSTMIDQVPTLLLFGSVIVVLIMLQKRCKIPSPYLIAPLIGTAALVLSGIPAPVLPPYVIAGAQVFMGIRMGLEVGSTKLQDWRKIMWVSFASNATVITVLLIISYVLSSVYPISQVTAFISTSPGGMSEMALTALMVNADLATVVAYQVFRMMFLLLVTLPLVRWWFKKSAALES